MARAGRFVRIQIGSTDVAGARSDSFQSNREHIDITNKDDEAVRKLLADAIASITRTLSCSGILQGSALVEWDADPDEVLKELNIVVPGVGTYTGLFGLAAFSIGAEYQDAATFEATFESGGEITFVAAAAPTNTVLPAVSGTVQVGQTLTALSGTWTGSPAFTYQWQQDDAGNGVFVNISGATGATYIPVGGVQGDALRVIVTGTNSAGSASATSAATVVVAAA
jgi:predicted secreted protein